MMPSPAENADIVALAQKAFADPQQDQQAAQAAMKLVANTLLLQEKTRQMLGMLRM